MIGEPGIPFNEAGWPKALEDDESRDQQIIALADQLKREDEDEALMAGDPQPTAPLSDYFAEAARRLEASE